MRLQLREKCVEPRGDYFVVVDHIVHGDRQVQGGITQSRRQMHRHHGEDSSQAIFARVIAEPISLAHTPNGRAHLMWHPFLVLLQISVNVIDVRP